MRYCRLKDERGTAVWARVEEREGGLWAVAAMEAPEEDLRGQIEALKAGAGGSAAFVPEALAQLEREGRLLAPVVPTKVVCVGRNYRDHAAELGNDVPTEPLIFLKPPSSLLAPGGVVRMPRESKRVDFEGELALVVGRRATRLEETAEARDYIRGYALLNDVTARDLQKSDPQWTRGKGFDTFCAVGPFVSDEVDPLAESLTLETRLNGERRQHGETKDFLFGIPELLRYITSFMTLEVGDVIATGTPAGVGPMQPGDTVEVEIAGLGVLRNTTSA